MRLCFWSSSGYQLLSFFSNCKDWGNASHSNYTSDHRYLFLGCNSNINRRGKRSFFFPLFGRKRGGISSWDRSEGQYLISFGAVTPGWEEMVWFCIAPLYLLLNTLIGCNATPSSNSSILITWVSLAVGVRLCFFFNQDASCHCSYKRTCVLRGNSFSLQTLLPLSPVSYAPHVWPPVGIKFSNLAYTVLSSQRALPCPLQISGTFTLTIIFSK